jgi:protocatechuate 3,4-dioxygenase beta subunit
LRIEDYATSPNRFQGRVFLGFVPEAQNNFYANAIFSLLDLLSSIFYPRFSLLDLRSSIQVWGWFMKRIIRFTPLLISLTVFNMVAARAQSAATSKAAATIAGRVTLDGAGAPGAHVMLKPYVNDIGARGNFGVEQPPALGAVTDAEGRYRITDVAPGTYRVSIFAPAYAVEGERAPSTPGKTINLADSDNVEGIDFALTRGAVITGKVTDDKDRPVIAAPVNAYKFDADGDRHRLNIFHPMYMRWETDDRGVYRIFGLEAGRYLVAAGFDFSGRKTSAGYRPTFYPNAADEAHAKVVEVKSGGEAANVDIRVAALAKGYVVTGRVVDADSGEPVPGAMVDYSPVIGGGYGFGTTMRMTNALGEFRFENVPPNSYGARVIYIDAQGRGSAMFGAEVKFDVVDGDVSGLEIKEHRGATISGVVAVDGSNDRALRAKLAQVNLYVVGRSGAMITDWPEGNGTISPNGTFKVSNVQPGKVRVVAGFGGPKGFALLRVEHNGVEVKAFDVNPGDQVAGVRLIFTYGNGVIVGRVEVKGGTLPAVARMKVNYRREGGSLAFEAPKSVEVDGRGQFLIEGLTQGTYRLSLDFPIVPGAFYLPTVEQIVTVAGEGRHEITFIVDLASKKRDK